jgi:maleate isomerase
MKQRHRIGLLIPASDIAMEADLWRNLPPDTTLHVARMYMESTTVAGETKMLREELLPAAHRLASVYPEMVVFGCTSAASILGLEGDANIARQVAEVTGCPCVTVVQSALHDIRQINSQRLLLVTPYIQEVYERMRGTLTEAGIPVVGVTGMGLDRDFDIGSVLPEEIQRFVIQSVRQSSVEPDCVFVACTTFRALEVAPSLEAELNIPVVTSNRGAIHAIHRHLNQSPPLS